MHILYYLIRVRGARTAWSEYAQCACVAGAGRDGSEAKKEKAQDDDEEEKGSSVSGEYMYSVCTQFVRHELVSSSVSGESAGPAPLWHASKALGQWLTVG